MPTEMYAPVVVIVALALLTALVLARRARRRATPSLPPAPAMTWTPASPLDPSFQLPRQADGTWREAWHDVWGDAR